MAGWEERTAADLAKTVKKDVGRLRKEDGEASGNGSRAAGGGLGGGMSREEVV